MKVSVNKYLNARSKSASVHSPSPRHLSPGDLITVADIVAGDVIEGNGIWYLSDDDGCYYWSGGTEEPNEEFKGRKFSAGEWVSFYKSALYAFIHEKAKFYKEFAGMGVGHHKRKKQPCLVLYLRPGSFNDEKSKVPEQFSYRGLSFAVRAESRKPAVAHFFQDDNPSLPMGGSMAGLSPVDESETELGTRSVLVFRGKTPFLLCCYHVACDTRIKASQTSVSASDGRTVNLPALVSQSFVQTRSFPVEEGAFTEIYDYALIKLDSADTVDNSIPGMGAITGFYSTAELSDPSFKTKKINSFGAVTQSRSGSIHSLESGAIPIQIRVTATKTLEFNLSGLIEASAISSAGDSGAPVVDEDGKLVGYVVAGDGNVSYILPFATLAFTLGFSLTPNKDET